MFYTAADHTFMICAYKENPFLEDCILSIINQKVLGTVKISTSTPNLYIEKLAKKYSIPVLYNLGEGTASDNMNFAYSNANTSLVTLCHQDDYYCPTYLEAVLQSANQGGNPIIIFTDYCENRNGQIVKSNLLLAVKRCLNFPLQFHLFQENKWVRKRILSFGSPICCPSVCFCKTSIPGTPFCNKRHNSWDWDAWIKMCNLNGKYIYCPQKLTIHRIWSDSVTTLAISNGTRDVEDYEILSSLWPKTFAKVIFWIYKFSQKSNIE